MPSSLLFALVLVATSALTVAGVLMLAGALRKTPGLRRKAALGTQSDAAFLFDGALLIDATPRGAALLATLRTPSQTDDWQQLTRFLAQDFPGLDAVLSDLRRLRHSRIASASGAAVDLVLDWQDGLLRLTLAESTEADSAVQLDRLSLRAMQEELAFLRQMTESAPFMMWREGPQGQITWANGAYMQRLTSADLADGPGWPLPRLIAADAPRRVELPAVGRLGPAWVDVLRLPDAAGVLAFALPADEAQHAERTRRDFVQTLTKTFATLPIGLAVFDRTRRLQVFNPALTDLTNLEPEFLLSRPGLEGFLNRMRDKHVLPEPRDYRAWSRRLLEIETSAHAGTFEETWSLPTGQTFRVSANPHPDGALAFLIEDITSETHLTRNVRAGMDTSQSVLNLLDQAIAVFAPNGQLVLTNTAFSRLWTLEGEETLSAVTLDEAIENWRDSCDDPDLWARIARLAGPGLAESDPVRGRMRLLDGDSFWVEARRTATQAVMISFDAEVVPAKSTPRSQILRASA